MAVLYKKKDQEEHACLVTFFSQCVFALKPDDI